jgi:predicted xylose isomerase-like sugar epimerase
MRNDLKAQTASLITILEACGERPIVFAPLNREYARELLVTVRNAT